MHNSDYSKIKAQIKKAKTYHENKDHKKAWDIFKSLYEKGYKHESQTLIARYLINGIYVKSNVEDAYKIRDAEIVDALRLEIAENYHKRKEYEKAWIIFSEIEKPISYHFSCYSPIYEKPDEKLNSFKERNLIIQILLTPFFNKPPNIIHKRCFFMVVFLSICQLFFEYAIYCTPPIIDSIFNTILITVLSRIVVSFFSNNSIISSKDILKFKINVGNVDTVLALIAEKDIKFFKRIYMTSKEPFKKEKKSEKEVTIVVVDGGGEIVLREKIMDDSEDKCEYVYAVNIVEMGLLNFIVYFHRIKREHPYN
ncbi:40176_t:CDS:2 [Gigaspora margarita]|uniref:40176_t:CDS:1 n=1 Tax=Gigaspora margarita TaxID=4874 RepID=A0ABN7VTZ0_GIGMA|nr:40176_t:CDS:2 [Gigaspora margarita]